MIVSVAEYLQWKVLLHTLKYEYQHSYGNNTLGTSAFIFL